MRAGLAMQDAMEEINERIAADVGASFALRVGINSGEVLAGRVGDGYTVIGDAVNVAARLQGAAEPGTVIVGEFTHRLTRAAIEYVELEPLELKGKAEPVPAWEAVRAVLGGRGARKAGDSSPLIGRGDESDLLISLYERTVNEGRPHLVTVIGQAGVGKSRLLREFAAQAGTPRPPARRAARQLPRLRRRARLLGARGDRPRRPSRSPTPTTARAAWGKLERGIAALVAEADTEESPERLAAALGRPLGIEPAGPGGVARARARSRCATGSSPPSAPLVEAAGRHEPMVFAVEDIHWADEGMLDLIEYLARWSRGPALILCLARDELLDRRPGWGGGRLNATTIALDPLERDQVRELVTSLMPGDAGAGGELVDQVAARSGGNPLFAEEMVNRIVEEGGADSEALPETVHSVLAARLDSLARSERRVLQAAAVVGQTFWEGSVDAPTSRRSTSRRRSSSLQEKDLVVADRRAAGWRASASTRSSTC